MRGSYSQLASAANGYINIQKGRGGVITVIQFESSASVVMERGTSNISESDCASGGTNFTAALQCALQVIGRTNLPGYECRILFFTDGGASIPTAELQRLRSANIRLDAIGFGSANQNTLSQLVTCGGQVTIGRTMTDIQSTFAAIAAADT
jgi:Mg-chelatase subunit ChlD